MIDDAGQEIELGMWYRLLEEKQDLLAEVKRLREGILAIRDTGTDTNEEWVIMAMNRLRELIE